MPPIEEQRKIAAILTTQDKVIELKEKRLAQKQRQKKYLMQQLLTGKKRLPGFSEEWKIKPLKKLTEKQRKKNNGFQYRLILSNSAQHGIVSQDQEFDKEIANEERIDGYYIVIPGAFVYNPRISVTAPCGPINVNETGETGIMSPLYTVFTISSPQIKAMLATNYKRDAIRYLECFEQFGDLNCAVVISPPDLRESVDDIDEGADDKVIAYWNKMMNRYGDADAYEEAMKNQFCAGEIDILIVCSKLLTGFDAPICQVLYIDKELKEHGLLQAIARTNRLYEGKDYGLIVDYRGLIEKLDTAMDLYSGAGLENFDSGDLKGVVVDVMSSVAGLREAYTRLTELFADLKNPRDTEEVEVFLADDKKRENFYNLLCAFGKALNMVLNAEQAYAAIPKDELKQYQNTFIFFSKVRRSVKIRYCDAIDNREYEPLMQNLLDTHLSVAGLKQITSPIDILNKDDFERELEELGSLRAKADAITSKLTRSISEKYQENPAYYDSFSKRIKDALEQYKEKVISEAEYLAKMRTIMEDYHAGKSTVTYPESIKNNVHAQAFYGVLSAVFDGAKEAEVSPDFAAEIAEEITKIVANHSQVDWTNNKTIHDRISQDIDDLFYDYEKERGLKLSFDTIDKIIENVKTVALRRF